MNHRPVSARINPEAGMEVLSKAEVRRLTAATTGNLYDLFRRCTLAVLTTGSESDDARAVLARHPDFDVRVVQQDRGVKLDLINAPAQAFVDGEIIRGIRQLLFAVLRDILYVENEIKTRGNFHEPEGITNAVFDILRNAGILRAQQAPNLVVCWGGHSIGRKEYEYTKKVGYELGLRGMDICTGCGPGAMKGPMKGATIAHAKQRIGNTRYIGITEPGIIAAESPNPIVNHLVIMPDIEKRLESFVRVGHAIIVFPGGVGTAEEILYLLGILLHPDNARVPFPVVFTGPKDSAAYFEQIDAFLKLTLGEAASERYRIIVGDPVEVARHIKQGLAQVTEHRVETKDAFFYNWTLKVPQAFQYRFTPTHEAMAELELHRDRPVHELAADLRRAFSGIVAGNVKEEGIHAIEAHGPYELSGEPAIMDAMDGLLQAFVDQHRMKLPGSEPYKPCYRLKPSRRTSTIDTIGSVPR
ncbi:MAG: LOG family protein [Xanthomonadales bacterium]|nr:Pyrimidine/purine nucleotide 5'-monophosphate nucleosidase [Xanthomonadales bacterium]MCC6594440.1 LOG family protein [Xanthomonadales bacterium]MCE7932501.1 LOG family protein [Xanthomonadales bacterium PRO6]